MSRGGWGDFQCLRFGSFQQGKLFTPNIADHAKIDPLFSGVEVRLLFFGRPFSTQSKLAAIDTHALEVVAARGPAASGKGGHSQNVWLKGNATALEASAFPILNHSIWAVNLKWHIGSRFPSHFQLQIAACVIPGYFSAQPSAWSMKQYNPFIALRNKTKTCVNQQVQNFTILPQIEWADVSA